MTTNLDSFYAELVVTACQMDADRIWMQGDLAIRINTEKPYSDSDIIDVDAFMKSLEQDGEFFIFSCCCGIPECAGWKRGIEVLHSEKSIQWTNLNNGKSWCFDKHGVQQNLITIRQEAENYKRFFSEKEIEYVGVGYNW